MKITGDMLIGARTLQGTQGTTRAVNPATRQEIEPTFGMGSPEDVNTACALAEAAFDTFRAAPLETRAKFLEAVAQNILDLGDTLIERAQAESGLPKARLEGERGRTVGQLRLFAKVVRDGHFHSAIIDPAQPERTPMPRADLRLRKIALGPVAVFGASNFPLAFSVAGGDTASAFAAGCPVVVKAHSAHLGTSELVGRAIQKAVADTGLPEGTFSLLIGAGRTIGEALVAHPAIKAVGFTGSRQGGLALVGIANARPEPIPVYAEMSSINPVFLLAKALANRGERIGSDFIDSLTMGVGQFCTNPGLVIALAGPDLDAFTKAAEKAISQKAAATMLTPGIFQAYESGVEKLAGQQGVKAVGKGLETNAAACAPQPRLFSTDAKTFLASKALEDEVFGPASLIIACNDMDEVLAVANHVEGQLTATLQWDAGDEEVARTLIPVLERKAGRILANGFPTGVEVSQSMVHGGPFPATSNAGFTSVGATAIERFLRPVCYQDIADCLLPESLKAANPLGIWRLVDGERVKA